MITVTLSKTKSKIVKGNQNIVYCVKYNNIAGVFRKDIDISFKFGRLLCDQIKNEFNNFGFFTTDEIPRYGLSQKDKEQILLDCNATNLDLVVIFAYPYTLALNTYHRLNELLLEKQA